VRIPSDSPITTVASTLPGIPGGAATQIAAGTVRSFNSVTYEATIQLAGSTATFLSRVPANLAIPVAALRSGARCVVAFFNPADPSDACVVAVFGRAPYRDDPDYFILNRNALNTAVLCGSGDFYLDRDTLNGADLG
jgi:hypothetical protein